MSILGLKGLKTVQRNSSSKHPVAIRVILLQFGPSIPFYDSLKFNYWIGPNG